MANIDTESYKRLIRALSDYKDAVARNIAALAGASDTVQKNMEFDDPSRYFASKMSESLRDILPVYQKIEQLSEYLQNEIKRILEITSNN